MSKMSSNWSVKPSRSATFSACAREPLVRMNFRPGSRAIAEASTGSGSTGEWSMSWTYSRKSSGAMPCSSISPRSVVP